MNKKELENEVLTGGSMNHTERIGATVHKTAKGHPMVRSYLQYLEKAGMTGVPCFLGLDEQEREVFTYLPGKTLGRDFDHNHPCLYSDETIIDAARFMRKLHDMSIGFLPEAINNKWNSPYFRVEEYETICHGDAAIWNFVFTNDRPTGLIDFEQAYPGTRIWDVTSTLFSVVPLTYFVYDPELRDAVAYEASKHAASRKRRIQLFFDAYGMECPGNIAELVAQRIQIDFCDDTIQRAAAGDEACKQMIERGDLAHYYKIISHLRAHGNEWR